MKLQNFKNFFDAISHPRYFECTFIVDGDEYIGWYSSTTQRFTKKRENQQEPILSFAWNKVDGFIKK